MNETRDSIPISVILGLAHDCVDDGDKDTASVLLALVWSWLATIGTNGGTPS